MNEIVVGIADLKVSNNPEEVLITYALGSCVCMAVYDPMVKVGGLLHFMLPDSSLDREKAKATPGLFADTGIPFLFQSCYAYGARKKGMIVKVAGGAQILDDTSYFRMGQKNITAMRRVLWRNSVLIDGDSTGQHFNRSMQLDISNGRCILKCSDRAARDL